MAYISIVILWLQLWKEYIGQRKNQAVSLECNSCLIESAAFFNKGYLIQASINPKHTYVNLEE